MVCLMNSVRPRLTPHDPGVLTERYNYYVLYSLLRGWPAFWYFIINHKEDHLFGNSYAFSILKLIFRLSYSIAEKMHPRTHTHTGLDVRVSP